MKKILFIIITMMLLIIISCKPAKQISIVSPQENEQWLAGSEKTIEWDAVGYESIRFRLEVFKGDNKLDDLSIEETGTSMQWKIPSDYEDGNDYKIKIIDKDNINIMSEVTFKILGDVITVTKPASSDSFDTASTITIEWTSKAEANITNVDIELWKGASKEQEIALNETNDGSYEWAVEDEIFSRDNYNIRISFSDEYDVFDKSDNFTITNNNDPRDVNLIGVWFSEPEESMKITYDDIATGDYEGGVVMEDYDTTEQTYKTAVTGNYTYDSFNNLMDVDAVSVANRMLPMYSGDEPDVMSNLPVTFTVEDVEIDPNLPTVDLDVTIHSLTMSSTYTIDNENPANSLFGALVGGNIDTLMGEWNQIMDTIFEASVAIIAPTPSEYNNSTGEKYVFIDTYLSYVYYDIDSSSGMPTTEEITETAEWTNHDPVNKTFEVINALETNEKLLNGTYKYKIVDLGIVISKPENEGETAPDPLYLEKEVR